MSVEVMSDLRIRLLKIVTIINLRRPSDYLRIISLCKLHKFSEKTYSCQTPFYFWVFTKHILSLHSHRLFSIEFTDYLNLIFHVNQTFLTFQRVLHMILYQMPVCKTLVINLTVLLYITLITLLYN